MTIPSQSTKDWGLDLVPLASTGRSTTRLGFGCAHLVGAIPWNKSLRLLDCAFDCGVRHFDVAPMYGFAEAERCLGELLKKHRGKVTVTTKFGIPPGKRQTLYRAARTASRTILGPLKSVVKRLKPPSPTPGPTPSPFQNYDVNLAERSLEDSLRNLNVEHIDIFLLHEATAAVLTDPRLLRFLESAVESGKVGAFGVGSDYSKIPALLSSRKEYCGVVQHQLTYGVTDTEADLPFTILHGVYSSAVSTIRSKLTKDEPLRRYWSECLNTNLADDREYAKVVMCATARANPKSVLLFSSSRLERIVDNCRSLDWDRHDSHLISFYRLLSSAAAGTL